jgi:endonuclease YncB( thermonuclease family)
MPVVALASAAILAAWLLGTERTIWTFPEAPAVYTPARVAVVDGDTVRVSGKLTRLVGFNTPETFEPLCAAERRLGQRATARLRQLTSSGAVEFAEVPCACRPGTEGTSACNYGRACGVLRVNGRDVGQTLIAEGLAVPFVCTGSGCPPTPRPWC